MSDANELRSLSEGDLKQKQGTLSEEFFNLKFRHKMGQLENPLQIRRLRKDIARVKTVLREKMSQNVSVGVPNGAK